MARAKKVTKKKVAKKAAKKKVKNTAKKAGNATITVKTNVFSGA